MSNSSFTKSARPPFPKLEEKGRRRLKVSDVAEYLGIKNGHVRQLIVYGHLTAINVGGAGRYNRYRVAENELFTFIERSRSEPEKFRAPQLRSPNFREALKKLQKDSEDYEH